MRLLVTALGACLCLTACAAGAGGCECCAPIGLAPAYPDFLPLMR